MHRLFGVTISVTNAVTMRNNQRIVTPKRNNRNNLKQIFVTSKDPIKWVFFNTCNNVTNIPNRPMK